MARRKGPLGRPFGKRGNARKPIGCRLIGWTGTPASMKGRDDMILVTDSGTLEAKRELADVVLSATWAGDEIILCLSPSDAMVLAAALKEYANDARKWLRK